jgi:hypothetical protein
MTRRWFNVGVVKLPHAARDMAHAVLGDRPDRAVFQDIVGADTPDDDSRFPVGAHCTYRAWLSDAEADRFRAASNCRYVVEDVTLSGGQLGPTTLPGWQVRSTLGYWPAAPTQLPGTTVNVAVMDSGTSSTLRAYMGFVLVARAVFPTYQPPEGENYPGVIHGSYCASNAVPPGGRLLDVIYIDGNGDTSDALIAQGVAYAVDQGAKVVSGSFGFTTALPATLDALNAAATADVVFYFATGNDGVATTLYPSWYGITEPGLPYVYSIGGWDMSTGYRWTDSSYHQDMTGLAPSILVRGAGPDATENFWYGTSAAAPCVANLCARLIGAGVSARDAGAALAATTTRMGFTAGEVGGGLFDLRAAAAELGVLPPAAAAVPTRRLRSSALAGAW